MLQYTVGSVDIRDVSLASSWGMVFVLQLQTYTTEEGFYSWTFPRQQPMWQTVLTVLFPIFTIACCLFPVFPYWAKLTVLYLLLSLLAAIFLLLFGEYNHPSTESSTPLTFSSAHVMFGPTSLKGSNLAYSLTSRCYTCVSHPRSMVCRTYALSVQCS